MSEISMADVQRARDIGAATYLTAYVELMSRHLGVEGGGKSARNAMALLMVEPVNRAVEATWCALMTDRNGMDKALGELKDILEIMAEKDVQPSE